MQWVVKCKQREKGRRPKRGGQTSGFTWMKSEHRSLKMLPPLCFGEDGAGSKKEYANNVRIC